ncbi:hypothetical protein MBLNU459_g0372t3 [Dothideomycetes sp. NU459]
MTFTNNKNLEWLLSHSETLEELSLDDCAIVPAFHYHGQCDEENYPESYSLRGEHRTWTYDARWHDYFHRLETEMPHLKIVRCGFGDWYDGNAFQTADSLGPTLWPQRYRLFDMLGFTRPPFPGGGYDGDWSDPPEYPDCTDEDLKALVRLRMCLNERARRDDDDQFLQLQSAILDRD